ncbi:MAG: MATE family efflux transporter, partial [Clostridia bacterium]|nr:MATE family efflux transporter [Clostridia bacterium]
MASMAARHDLTEGVVWKKLLGFFFPILLGLLFQQLYNTVDAVIVGRFVGDSALAAVGGGAATIINMIIGFCTGLNSGATVIVAQTYVSGDHDTLSRVLNTSIVFCAIIGLI